MSYIADRILNAKDDTSKYQRPRSRAEMAASKVTEAEAKKVARAVLRREVPVSQALEAAGYSKKQALKGMQRVKQSRYLRQAFAQEKAKILAELAESGPELNVDQTEALIMNRLKSNIVEGTDKAVMSCKLAGSHKKLSLWEVDVRTGIIIVDGSGISPRAHLEVPDDVNGPSVIAHSRDEVPED